MADKVLGPEWGNLSGLPAEKALEYVAQYAADLEKKQAVPVKPAQRRGEVMTSQRSQTHSTLPPA